MINVTVIKPEVSYPKLRIFKSYDKYMIVLFRTDRIGIVVDTNTNDYSDYFSPIGHFSNTWNPKVFKDYDGEIVLSKAKYKLMYNNKNIIIIVNGSDQSNGDAIGFVLDGEDIFYPISINKADYKIFEGTITLKNKDE